MRDITIIVKVATGVPISESQAQETPSEGSTGVGSSGSSGGVTGSSVITLSTFIMMSEGVATSLAPASAGAFSVSS